MLLINGFSNILSTFLGLTPGSGSAYWAKDQRAAFFVLKDFNTYFIHPKSLASSTARQRFQSGYKFAQVNFQKIQSHILVSGNRLQIVAHSHGVAFAEGISAFLYEEEGFVTDLLVAIQGSQMAHIPQEPKAIRCRLVFRTDGDYVANRKGQSLLFYNIEITESPLKSGFTRYRIIQNIKNVLPSAEYIYMKVNIPLWKRHFAHRDRQFEVWTAINHALSLYNNKPENTLLLTPMHIKPEVLHQYAHNQN